MNKEIVFALLIYVVIGWLVTLFFIAFHEKASLTKSIKNLILIPIATPLILLSLPIFAKTTKKIIIDSINEKHPEASEKEKKIREEIINRDLTQLKLLETTLRILFNLPKLFKIQANLIVSMSKPVKSTKTEVMVSQNENKDTNPTSIMFNINDLFVSFRRVLVDRIDNKYS